MPPAKLTPEHLELLIHEILPAANTLEQAAHLLKTRTGVEIYHRTMAESVRRYRPGIRVGNLLGSGSGVTNPDVPAVTNADLHCQIAKLQKELKAAQKEAHSARAVKKLLGNLKESPPKPPRWLTEKRKGSLHGTPTLFLSDLHWGEVVFPKEVEGSNEYNLTIARERLQRVFERTVHLCDSVFAQSEYPGIVLACGGDLFSGNIHEELSETNEKPVTECMVDLAKHMRAGIDLLRKRFGRVFIPWVVGNHSRLSRKPKMKHGPSENFDWLLGSFLEFLYKDDEAVDFYVSDAFTAHYQLHSTRYLLVHGDGFRGGSGIAGPLTPWALGDHRLRKQRQSMAAWTATPTDYDILLFGHFHQCFPGRHWIANGSLVGFNEYAKKRGFSFEPPMQMLWFTTPKYGIVMATPIFAEDPRGARAAVEWVSLPGGT